LAEIMRPKNEHQLSNYIKQVEQIITDLELVKRSVEQRLP